MENGRFVGVVFPVPAVGGKFFFVTAIVVFFVLIVFRYERLLYDCNLYDELEKEKSKMKNSSVSLLLNLKLDVQTAKL